MLLPRKKTSAQKRAPTLTHSTHSRAHTHTLIDTNSRDTRESSRYSLMRQRFNCDDETTDRVVAFRPYLPALRSPPDYAIGIVRQCMSQALIPIRISHFYVATILWREMTHNRFFVIAQYIYIFIIMHSRLLGHTCNIYIPFLFRFRD